MTFENEQLVDGQVGAFLRAWMPQSYLLISAMRSMQEFLPQSATLMKESIQKLSNDFSTLSRSTLEQAENVQKVVEMAGSIHVNGESVPLDVALNEINRTLEGAVDKILHVSCLAVSMAGQFDVARSSLGEVKGFISSIQKITRQTKLLSLNATIEAEVAKEAGKGFRVVADEVKSLSQEITQLSEEMERKIGEIVRSVNMSHETLQQVATIDMTENIMVREQIDSIMHSILEQNRDLTGVLNRAAASSRSTSESISGMVMSIQFEDRVTQVLGNTVEVLGVLEQIELGFHMAAQRIMPPNERMEVDAELCDRIIKGFKLSEFNKLFVDYLRSHHESVGLPDRIMQAADEVHVEEEEIELF